MLSSEHYQVWLTVSHALNQMVSEERATAAHVTEVKLLVYQALERLEYTTASNLPNV